MEKRDWLKEKQLMIWARTGAWVTQSSLDEVFISDDEIIQEQIEALRELKEHQPKLAKDINSDLSELLTNPNTTRIKQYNEQYATNMRNDTETSIVEILYWLSIFENANLTLKQKDLLIDIVEGYSYEGKHKDYGFMINKIEKSKGGVNKMSDKRQFSANELQKLFPSYFAKPQEQWDCYLNHSKKLDCYEKSVNESKIRMDRIRALSLATSIFPLELNLNKE